jgi:hypothetical protein
MPSLAARPLCRSHYPTIVSKYAPDDQTSLLEITLAVFLYRFCDMNCQRAAGLHAHAVSCIAALCPLLFPESVLVGFGEHTLPCAAA